GLPVGDHRARAYGDQVLRPGDRTDRRWSGQRDRAAVDLHVFIHLHPQPDGRWLGQRRHDADGDHRHYRPISLFGTSGEAFMSAATETVSAGSARTARIVIYTLLVVLAAVYLLPLYVMLTTSLKSLDEIRAGDMLALPRAPSLASWFKAWGEACIGVTCEGIKGYFWNSLKM